MLKTLKAILKRDKEKFSVPKKVQDTIPVEAIYPDGIFRHSGNKYSKSYQFSDINFAVLSEDEKEAVFYDYQEILNGFDTAATTKLTINNRKINKAEFEENILLPMRNDGLDYLRSEYNEMLTQKVASSNAIIQEKYVTISINKKNVDDARTYFARVGAELSSRFKRIGSVITPLYAEERLKIAHDFYRIDDDSPFHFDIKNSMQKGYSFKDEICPDSMEFNKDFIKIGDKYVRAFYLQEYSSGVRDDFLASLVGINKNLMLSIDVSPIPMSEAIKEAESKLLGVETNITNWQRKQNSNNNFSATVPYDLEQQRTEMKSFLDDLTSRDQRMRLAVITMVITADSKKQLDEDTEELMNVANSVTSKLTTLTFQQLEGLNTAMPFGVRKIDVFRTLTTESLAIFIPFNVQDVFHEKGIYYGINPRNSNLIIADRTGLLNGNSFILGVSGGGKSFTAKMEIILRALANPDIDVILIDPEREYKKLTDILHGQHIVISANSNNHINAMDMNKSYGEGVNPLADKSQFIMSLCEQILGSTNIKPEYQSIIDRCSLSVYQEFISNGYKGKVPTLYDLYDELLKQPEPEAKQLALAVERFVTGSLNTFAQKTNVNVNNRIVCYDILELGKDLMPVGMLAILDNILNRITSNREKGKKTFIFIDEIYLLFEHPYSAIFLQKLWKRARKYGACITGITQNVEDLLQSHTARTMLANSEFIVMLNQAAEDRAELSRLLHISDAEAKYIENVKAGHGLIKIGSSMVPFENDFPKNTQLYKIMSTKPGEEI